jgi:hypothetical protein
LYPQPKGKSQFTQVQKKGDEIENFATFFNSKNHKKTFFQAWKQHTDKNKYIRKME